MWNQVIKIDPAYVLWARNTRPDAHFSKHFLDAANIQLIDQQESYYGEHRAFNE